MKLKLLTAADCDILSNLGCECEVCFFNISKNRNYEKNGRQKKLAPIKVWFVGRGFKMCKEIGLGFRWSIEIQLT